MSGADALVLEFRGRVACLRFGEGPLGLILRGETEGRPGEPVEVAFTAIAPRNLPETLEAVRVQQLGPRGYCLTSGSREWTVEGTAHVHRDVGSRFYEALPGRPVPWRKRVFWRFALALAGCLNRRRE